MHQSDPTPIVGTAGQSFGASVLQTGPACQPVPAVRQPSLALPLMPLEEQVGWAPHNHVIFQNPL